MKTISSLLVMLFLAGCFGREPVKTSRKGERMPEFSLFLADSSTYFNTTSLKEGKPVIFFYFGPGCPYCRGQMEEIIAQAEKLKNIQFVLLTTSIFEEMKWFCTHYQLNKYHNMIIGLDYTNFFGDYFGAQGVPYFAVYGLDRKLKKVFDGKVPVRQLINAVLE